MRSLPALVQRGSSNDRLSMYLLKPILKLLVMADLNFAKDIQGRTLLGTEYVSKELNFWDLKDHEIPQKPGAYILRARGTRFQYPRGTNSVFYIGQSANLQKRLLDHLKFAIEAKSNRKFMLYRSRYEYLAAFGTHYVYIPTWHGLKPKALEDVLMAHFAEKHLSFPVANGAGAWKRIGTLI